MKYFHDYKVKESWINNMPLAIQQGEQAESNKDTKPVKSADTELIKMKHNTLLQWLKKTSQ